MNFDTLSMLCGYRVIVDNPTETVQCRTHKKKRINKKWAKRYGFKEVKRKSFLKDGQCLLNEMEHTILCNQNTASQLMADLGK